MKRTLNFTNRIKIKEESIGISVREIPGAPSVASVSAKLGDYKLPPDAEVVVEAYRKSAYMRERIGTVASLPDQHEFALKAFGSPEGVRFRLKVTGRREDAPKNAPLLFAIADQINPNNGEEQNADMEKLLPMVSADLSGEIWRLDLDDGPALLIDQSYWDERGSFVRSGWFFSLVIPTVLRQAITAALADNYREVDDEDWKSRWLRFALTMPGEPGLPAPGNDFEEWVTMRVEGFCRHLKMRDRFEAAMRGAD